MSNFGGSDACANVPVLIVGHAVVVGHRVTVGALAHPADTAEPRPLLPASAIQPVTGSATSTVWKLRRTAMGRLLLGFVLE